MLLAAALLGLWGGDLRRVFLLTAVPAACVLLVIGLVVRDRPAAPRRDPLRLSLRPFGPGFLGSAALALLAGAVLLRLPSPESRVPSPPSGSSPAPPGGRGGP